MVVMCGCVFRNFLAFSFFVIHRVFFGNFRIAMLPIRSWGMRLVLFGEGFGNCRCRFEF